MSRSATSLCSRAPKTYKLTNISKAARALENLHEDVEDIRAPKFLHSRLLKLALEDEPNCCRKRAEGAAFDAKPDAGRQGVWKFRRVDPHGCDHCGLHSAISATRKPHQRHPQFFLCRDCCHGDDSSHLDRRHRSLGWLSLGDDRCFSGLINV